MRYRLRDRLRSGHELGVWHSLNDCGIFNESWIDLITGRYAEGCDNVATLMRKSNKDVIVVETKI